MKNVIINFSVLITMLMACSPVTEKNTDKIVATAAKEDTIITPSPIKDTVSKLTVPQDFLALVPIDLLNDKSTDVYEKYGIEFSGNCYACDLASLSVTKNKMIWTNVCDENDTFEIDDFSFSKEENKTILKTSARTYMLTQIDQAPVYELVVAGQELALYNKRISRYFTTKEALPFFKEHDCGDFGG